MYQDNTVGVVIPAYNEAGFVGEVIETVPDYVDRIYPVDDCSTDGTWDEIVAAARAADGASPPMSADGGARSGDGSAKSDGVDASDDASLSDRIDRSADGADRSSDAAGPPSNGIDPDLAALPDDLDFSPPGDAARVEPPTAIDDEADGTTGRRVVPIRHEENRGVGGAIKTGYQRARADRIDVTVVMGGDGQMDPDWMADLLEPVVDGRAEYAKANRLIVDEHHETMPRHRFVGNHTLTILTKIATGYWSVGDPQHGYTAISLHALETVEIDELYEFFGYCNDLLIRLSAANLRVADVPCPLTYADEQSHITYGSYIPRVSGMLLRSFLRRLWGDRDSAAGRGRLALFLGGAIATVGGLLGIVASGLAGAGSADGAARSGDATTSADATGGAEGAAAADADDEASDDDPDTATDGASSSGVCSAALVAVAGVATLLGAMLLDAVTNSTNNYTERVPEDAEPRVGNPGAGESGMDD